MKKFIVLICLFSILSAYGSADFAKKTEVYSWFGYIQTKLECFLNRCGILSDQSRTNSTKKELEKQLRDAKSELSWHELYVADLALKVLNSESGKAAQALERTLSDLEADLKLKRSQKKKSLKSVKKEQEIIVGKIAKIRQQIQEAEKKMCCTVEYQEYEWRKQEIERLKEKVQEILNLLQEYKE